MFIDLDDNIWLAEMPASVKITALAIAKHQNDPHQAAFPSESRLAKMTGLGISSIKRSIHWLIDHKCLTVEHKLSKFSKWPVNHYRWRKGLLALNPGCKIKWWSTVDGVQNGLGSALDEVESTVVQSGVTVVHESSIESSINH
jgi:hypothetical protein